MKFLLTLTLFTSLPLWADIFDKEHAPVEEIAALSSGSDIGGGNLDVGYLATWCTDAVVLLEDALKSARLALLKDSNYYQANTILLQAYDAALESSLPERATAFTLKAIGQGRDLLVMMGARDLELSMMEREILFNFFEKYTQFIAGTVYSELDQRFYFPYQKAGHGDCYECYDGIAQFERRFVQYAAEQLNLLVSYFVTTGETLGEVFVSEPKLFLRATEFLTLAVAQTMDDSFWSAPLACSSKRLKSINKLLQQYNLGSRARYPNDRLAALDTYIKLAEIISDIEGC